LGTIPGASAPTAAVVADAVWDEARADHKTAGSTGEGLNHAHADAVNKVKADKATGETTLYDDDGTTELVKRKLEAGASDDEVLFNPQ
jgi:hypothetical protein